MYHRKGNIEAYDRRDIAELHRLVSGRGTSKVYVTTIGGECYTDVQETTKTGKYFTGCPIGNSQTRVKFECTLIAQSGYII